MNQESDPSSPIRPDSGSSSRARTLLRTVLFFAGSAAFGGLAVALWDRKALTAMRRKDLQSPPSTPRNDDIE